VIQALSQIRGQAEARSASELQRIQPEKDEISETNFPSFFRQKVV
jgi:hypothetical protein